MKRGRSTSTPTKEEAAYIVACKEGPCIPCEVWSAFGEDRCDGAGCDFHHMKSGNIRRGHMYGIGACVWHHRGQPLDGWTAPMMRETFGPSLMDGGKLFKAAYGTDDHLLKLQKRIMEGKA